MERGIKIRAIAAAAVLILGMLSIARATVVEVSVSTDKPMYLLEEVVTVFVTAYNPNPEAVTLGFGNSLQVSYLMDGIFDWTEGKAFGGFPNSIVIEPYNSHMWDCLSHGPDEMAIYPLDVGTHTVRGEVVGYGYSEPVEFEVVPEPTTFSLFAFGALTLRASYKQKILE